IRSIDSKDIPSLKEILGKENIEKVNVKDVLYLLYENNSSTLLIDARSEKEFEDSSIPYSVNFPVLNNSERHNTGLIYKKYSRSSALYLAMEYANPKMDSLNRFLSSHNASDKIIIIYCWRGGGRSGYLSKMISELGYKPMILTGGQKSFRKYVNDFFAQEPFPFELIEISGLTGSGKTELLKAVSVSLPVIDLEDAAKHYSSLLGHIPYEIKNIPAVTNQSAFENNIFSQIFFNKFNKKALPDNCNSGTSGPLTFLIESESKKVGSFQIPENLYNKMKSATGIRIITTLENRVKRIVNDYFGTDLKGIEPMKRIIIEKVNFFRQQLSKNIYDKAILLLDQKRVEEFTEIMIVEYYDKKYTDKGKKPCAEIFYNDLDTAQKELLSLVKKLV
ncbi:MAG: tRNA 2-selenouridine(34) synthase MnmH, partial [bacterium]